MFNFLKKIFTTPPQEPENREQGNVEPNTPQQSETISTELPIEPLLKKMAHHFSFVEKEYGYRIKEKGYKKETYQCIYERGDRQVFLRLDFAALKLTFLVFYGRNISYQQHLDTDEVKDFYWLFKQYEPTLHWQDLQPKGVDGWEKAIELNAALLEKYGVAILTEEE